MGWREQLETVFGGRRTVELTVRVSPEEALRVLREHLVSEGGYGVTTETVGVLEVEDRSRAANWGCGGWILILVLIPASFGLALVLVLIWALTQIRRLRLEASPSDSGGSRLTVSGYPQQAVADAEEWIHANLPIRDQR